MKMELKCVKCKKIIHFDTLISIFGEEIIGTARSELENPNYMNDKSRKSGKWKKHKKQKYSESEFEKRIKNKLFDQQMLSMPSTMKDIDEFKQHIDDKRLIFNIDNICSSLRKEYCKIYDKHDEEYGKRSELNRYNKINRYLHHKIRNSVGDEKEKYKKSYEHIFKKIYLLEDQSVDEMCKNQGTESINDQIDYWHKAVNDISSHIDKQKSKKNKKPKLKYLCRCPLDGCLGLVEKKGMVCNVCNSIICKLCREVKFSGQFADKSQFSNLLENNHKCNKEHVENIEAVNKYSKPCPTCAVPINKNGGCDHMNCSRCHTHFSWDTGSIFQVDSQELGEYNRLIDHVRDLYDINRDLLEGLKNMNKEKESEILKLFYLTENLGQFIGGPEDSNHAYLLDHMENNYGDYYGYSRYMYAIGQFDKDAFKHHIYLIFINDLIKIMIRDIFMDFCKLLVIEFESLVNDLKFIDIENPFDRELARYHITEDFKHNVKSIVGDTNNIFINRFAYIKQKGNISIIYDKYGYTVRNSGFLDRIYYGSSNKFVFPRDTRTRDEILVVGVDI